MIFAGFFCIFFEKDVTGGERRDTLLLSRKNGLRKKRIEKKRNIQWKPTKKSTEHVIFFSFPPFPPTPRPPEYRFRILNGRIM